MHFAYALPALAGLAAALPQPQVLNFNAIAAAPQPTITGPPVVNNGNQTVYNGASAVASASAAAATASLQKRDADCAPQANLNGPVPVPNTVSGFENSATFSTVAIAAAAQPPNGFVDAFINYNGSMTGAGYLGYYSLESYDVQACANYCNSTSTCLSFNIFYERDPTLFPAAACPNPTAGTAIKCTLWGVPSSKAAASNFGQYRDQFQVVIAGSNAYNLVSPIAASIPSFTAADVLAGTVNNVAAFIGSEYYNQPYNPAVCSAVCLATNAQNQAAAKAAGLSTYTACNYFNSFVLSQNGAATGMYCNFYSAVSSNSATSSGTSSNGVSFAYSNSLGYALSVIDPGHF